MHLLRPLLATLALSLTLPLSAATDEIYEDETPHKVEGDGEFKDYITDFLTKDKKGALFWFRLEPGATLTLDAGLSEATLRIETAGTPDNPATLRFTKEGYISYQRSPIELLRANDVQNGTLRLTCDSWTEYDETKRNASTPAWTPSSRTIDCNLTFASPLPVDSNGNAYVVDEIFTIPSGCTFRLEAYSENPNQLPEIAFADETSTLVFAWVAKKPLLAQKYCDLLASSRNRFIVEGDTTIDSQLTFMNAPKIEIVGAKLYFEKFPPQFKDCTPSFIVRNDGTLNAPQSNLPTVRVEENGTLQNIYKLDCLTGNGTVTLKEGTVSKNMDIYAIRVDSEEVLKINGNSNCQVQRIEGSGTVSFMGYIGSYNWKDLDAILRESKFTGTFESASSTICNNIDFTEINENTFDYTLMPHFPDPTPTTLQLKIKMRLEQYVNCKIKWPTEKNRLHRITLELIESGSFKGKATVPAFEKKDKKLSSFTLLSADDNTPIDCTVEYGEGTNTLTWEPTSSAMAGFTGLPDVVNKALIDKLTNGKKPGKVTGKTPTEATKALECFSGIYAFVDSQDNPETVVDLNVNYDFGISRLTFVDGGENILIEVSLTSDVDATTTPTFLGKPTLFANGNPLDVTPLTDEEIAKRGLSAPNGSTTLWFLVPYNTLPETGDLTITVSANPPQAN